MLRGRSMRRLLLRPRCRRSRRWGSRRRRAVVVAVGAAAVLSRRSGARCCRRCCCRPPRPPRLRRCAAAARGARAAWPVGARLSEFYVISPLRGDPECLSWHGATRLDLIFRPCAARARARRSSAARPSSRWISRGYVRGDLRQKCTRYFHARVTVKGGWAPSTSIF